MSTDRRHINEFGAGYTKFGDVPDHKFAKFLRKVTHNNFDYEHCLGYTLFFNGKTKQFVAAVSYDNKHCTKSVNVLESFSRELEIILES